MTANGSSNSATGESGLRYNGNGQLDVGIGATTNDTNIEIGRARSASGPSYVDMIGDTTYTDYGLRVIRNSSSAGTGQIRYNGAGSFEFFTDTSTPMTWYISSVQAMQLSTSRGLGVGVNGGGTAGRIDALNDIVAFSSDRRLKKDVKVIENAIDKVLQLKGITYNWNQTAEDAAGFKQDIREVGVFAQDLLRVLPEAVKLAPFDNDGTETSISGENYLTVQYHKIVPLLIEAIKELEQKIIDLKK